MRTFFLLHVVCLIISNVCNAQVPVSKEPRHHKVFQNEYIRVLDAHIVPGDTTLFHKHEIPSVFIVLTNSKTGSELINKGATTSAPVTYGNIWFDGFYTEPRIHRIWNNDTIEFHVMDIELLNKAYKDPGTAMLPKPMQMLFDEKPVKVYTCSLKAGSTINLNNRKRHMLIVGLSDTGGEVTLNDKVFKQKGDYLFIPAGTKNALINKGSTANQFVVCELK
jgi:hypothetical protein